VQKNIKMLAKTLAGLEDVLLTELEAIGAKELVKANRAVAFEGDLKTLYQSNYLCRTALRVLLPIQTFKVRNQEELYSEINRIDWTKYMKHTDTLAIDSVANANDAFTNTMFVSMKVKDAIADQFRTKFGARPSVDTDNPTLRVNIHIFKQDCTVSLDSSGSSLHKRGYRLDSNKAPLNEVLGAGLVLLSGWDKESNFVDPMCGSGTLLTEACMIAKNIPPGYFRKEFSFQKWQGDFGFDKELWASIVEEAKKNIVPLKAKIYGSDSAKSSVFIAKDNLKSAGVREDITIQNQLFQDTTAPEGGGVVIMNPPYGERMDKDDVTVLYKSIGDTLKSKYQGYDAWIISSNREAVNSIGLKASRRIVIFNGPLECRFLKYEMYRGTKKIRPLDEASQTSE
jgi:putative N6-adenine-specific DNA methylase